MAKKKSRSVKNNFISPINPSIHYALFLVLALILVIVVAIVMQKTATETRARLMCPMTKQNLALVLEETNRRCKYGVQLSKDANGCDVWVCKMTSPIPLQFRKMMQSPLPNR